MSEKPPSEMNLLELFSQYVVEEFKKGYKTHEEELSTGGSIKKRDLLDQSPKEFERTAARLYELRGYDVEITQAGADGGLDAIAKRENMTVGIQAKQYSEGNKVGAKTVRETYASTHRLKLLRPSIITTSEFTRNAEKEADDLGVELVDGDDLLDELNR